MGDQMRVITTTKASSARTSRELVGKRVLSSRLRTSCIRITQEDMLTGSASKRQMSLKNVFKLATWTLLVIITSFNGALTNQRGKKSQPSTRPMAPSQRALCGREVPSQLAPIQMGVT